ncbi:hypothetical protein RF11_06231 [Thelohanellus kitauei]|uniref:Uncharacterized protein n=1 Tax=Thelohanellus kitauei TaxID=669202 RepID=A0A0C2IEJ7_THEKT|nr:hypothetical protein RF11_06231 [Thelohanellus kitauei]
MLQASNFIRPHCKNIINFRTVSFTTFDKTCNYPLYSYINCHDSELNVKKYIYSPELQYHIFLFHKKSLIIVKYSPQAIPTKYELVNYRHQFEEIRFYYFD